MSGTLSLGLNSTGEPTPFNINASGELIVTTGGGAGTTNVDVVANSIGLATQTTLASADSHLSGIATDTLDISSKILQGYDAQVASGGSGLQQNLVYGRDTSGNLDALRTDASGHLEVVVSDFVKGQALMAASFPVVISSDQSAVEGTKPDATNTIDTLSPTSGSTAVTTAVDLDGSNGNFTAFGNTSNLGDALELELSADNVTYYRSGDFFVNVLGSGDYAVQLQNIGARYVRLSQTDTLLSGWSWVNNSSRR